MSGYLPKESKDLLPAMVVRLPIWRSDVRNLKYQPPLAAERKIYNYVSSLSYLTLDCRAGKIEEGIQYRNLSALITQREGVNQYGDPVDILESGYVRFYELLGFIPKTIPTLPKMWR